MDTCFTPNHPIAEGEEVLDHATEYERKLYSLMQFYRREFEQACIDMKYSSIDRQDETMHKHICQAQDKADLLKELMWACISERLPHRCGTSLGIRDGWLIVNFSNADEDPRDFLRKLLGQ